MADVKTNLCEFRIRRDKDGIRLNVKTSDELTAAFKSMARDRKEAALFPGMKNTVNYWRVALPFSDHEIGWAVFALDSNKEKGIEILLSIARTKDQLRACAEEISRWLNDFYEKNMRVVDITVSVQSRILSV